MTSATFRGFALLLFVLSLNAGEAPAVPAPIKSTLDTYENDAERAYAAYRQALAKAADKAAKDMETKLKAATKSGNLDLANAIKKEMDALTKGETLAILERRWRSTDLLNEFAKNTVSILSAKYGANDNLVDITTILRQRFNKQSNSLVIQVSGMVFGIADPAPDVVKYATVDYAVNGERKSVKVRDGDMIRINVAEEPAQVDAQPVPVAGTAGVDAVVGKWGDGTTVMWEFKADGTGQHFWSGSIYPFTWVKNDAGYSVVVAGHRPRPLSFVDKNTIQVEPGRSIRMK